jgi:hypothetical protein
MGQPECRGARYFIANAPPPPTPLLLRRKRRGGEKGEGFIRFGGHKRWMFALGRWSW